MRLAVVAVAALALAGPALAKPSDYRQAIAAPGRAAEDIALDAGRKPAEVLDFLGLEPGMAALDMMAGTGYYTEIMARHVGPKGKVVALEPKAFYDDARAQSRWQPLLARQPNVSVLAQTPDAFAVPPASVDFILMHLTYHDFYWESAKFSFPRLDPDAVMKMFYAAVRPGGIVGVIDHVGPSGGDTRVTVDKLHRIDPAVVKADFKRAGFVLEAESPLLRNKDDDLTKLVFDPAVRGKTDRVLYRFRKPR